MIICSVLIIIILLIFFMKFCFTFFHKIKKAHVQFQIFIYNLNRLYKYLCLYFLVVSNCIPRPSQERTFSEIKEGNRESCIMITWYHEASRRGLQGQSRGLTCICSRCRVMKNPCCSLHHILECGCPSKEPAD